jgi:hypothetical protein
MPTTRLHRHLLGSAVSFVLAAPAFAQGTPSEAARPITYGVELAFRSGHADRGYLISDRPVIQPVMWVSGNGTDFSAWGNFTLAENSDGSRPNILEFELTRTYEWSKLSIGPGARMYFYHDPLSSYRERSLEGWLFLAYDAGPFRLFTNHSLDVLTYKGSYFVDAGIEAGGALSERVELKGSVGAGWASAMFNQSWFDVPTAALNRAVAQGSLTAYLTPHLYLVPHFEYNRTLDPAVRAAQRPTYLLVGLTLGGEF